MHPSARIVTYYVDTHPEPFTKLKELSIITRPIDDRASYDPARVDFLKEHFLELRALFLENVWVRSAIMCMLLQNRDLDFIQQTLELSGLHAPPLEYLDAFRYWIWDPALLNQSELEDVLNTLPEELDKSQLRACFYHPTFSVLYKHGLLPPVPERQIIDAALSLAYKKIVDSSEQSKTRLVDLLRAANQLIKLKNALKESDASKELISVLKNIAIELEEGEDDDKSR